MRLHTIAILATLIIFVAYLIVISSTVSITPIDMIAGILFGITLAALALVLLVKSMGGG